MKADGLTAEEQERLIAEGVTTTQVFNGLSDEQFGISGIHIAARREEKWLRDQAAEDERHAEEQRRHAHALWQQVQALITKELGSGAAASKLEHVASEAELRALDLSSMNLRGLGIGTPFPSLPPQTSHLVQLCHTHVNTLFSVLLYAYVLHVCTCM